MATTLYLRDTTNNGIGSFKDMVTTAGSSTATGTVNTVASGTEIQWTDTAGGTVLEWISGRFPSGGATLTTGMTFSLWARESNMNANCQVRARVFKREPDGTETERGNGPWDDGAELQTSDTEMSFTTAVQPPDNLAFAENDRLVVRFYISNIGTMGGGQTCVCTYNGAAAATGDSFLLINENITFKEESTNPSVNVNDSITVTESVTAMLNPILFNVNDTATVTESVKMNMLLLPQPFDTVTVTEQVNMNLVNNIGVFDTVTVTEDARVHILVMPSVFDSVTVAESVTALLTSLNISADDTVTLTESVNVTLNEGVAGLSVDIFDTVTVTEDAGVHIFLMPTVNDSVTVTEATQRNMLLFPRPFDSVTVTDAPQMNMLVMPSVFDSITVTEDETVSVVSVSAIQISAFDSITVADDSTVLLPWLALFVSDSITVTEDITVTESGVEPPATGGTSGGGYYRYFSAEEMSYKREIRALEKKEKEVVRQVKKLEQKIDDKQDEIAYARNMATLQRMINELEALHKKLEFMRKKLEEIEEEEMLLIATIFQEYEQRLN